MQLHIFLQIVLEMLPVSSSGNVTLLFHFLLQQQNGMQQFVMHDAFGFLLHGSAVIVVGFYFFKPWLEYLVGCLQFEKKSLYIAGFCIIADALTTGFYLLFGAIGTDFFPLWLGFFVTGVGLWSVKLIKSSSGSSRLKPQDDIRRNAVILGITQGLALLPGISRFGSTFVVGRWLGFSNMQAFQISFLIGWPLMLLGTLKGFWQVHQAGQMVQLLRGPVLFSMLIATVLSWFVLSWVASIIKRGSLWKFCWWLWILAAVALFVTV
jgi:undecaprenyl-diphosphatase